MNTRSSRPWTVSERWRQILVELQEQHGNEFLGEPEAVAISQWLVNSNLIQSGNASVTKRLDQQAKRVSRQKMISLLNPICFRLSLLNPNRLIRSILPYTKWLFSTGFAVIWIVVALMATQVMYSHWEQIGQASIGIFAEGRWIWILSLWVALKLIHELAHGIACQRYGGEVPDAGVLILLFTPLPFVNVTSSWRFPNRWHRIVVAAAGMYVELFIAFLALIAWSGMEASLYADLCFNVFITGSVTTVLFNANPLMRFDGYYMLSDAIGVPNLYPKGTRWFGDRLKVLLFGLPKTPNLCAPNELKKVAIYGSMAFFWKLLISISLVIGASVLFHGAGIVLGVGGMIMWFGIPIYRQLASIFGPDGRQKISAQRTVFSAAAALALVICGFTILRGPATKSAPAIVQFKKETILRAGADGFVKRVLAYDGQPVRAGQKLVLLENRELSNEVLRLELLLNEARIQSRIHRDQGELALAMVEEENVASLQINWPKKPPRPLPLRSRHPLMDSCFSGNWTTCWAAISNEVIRWSVLRERWTRKLSYRLTRQIWKASREIWATNCELHSLAYAYSTPAWQAWIHAPVLFPATLLSVQMQEVRFRSNP